jgi:hypothetical protein
MPTGVAEFLCARRWTPRSTLIVIGCAPSL